MKTEQNRRMNACSVSCSVRIQQVRTEATGTGDDAARARKAIRAADADGAKELLLGGDMVVAVAFVSIALLEDGSSCPFSSSFAAAAVSVYGTTRLLSLVGGQMIK